MLDTDQPCARPAIDGTWLLRLLSGLHLESSDVCSLFSCAWRQSCSSHHWSREYPTRSAVGTNHAAC